jgi:hypothetical protein
MQSNCNQICTITYHSILLSGINLTHTFPSPHLALSLLSPHCMPFIMPSTSQDSTIASSFLHPPRHTANDQAGCSMEGTCSLSFHSKSSSSSHFEISSSVFIFMPPTQPNPTQPNASQSIENAFRPPLIMHNAADNVNLKTPYAHAN